MTIKEEVLYLTTTQMSVTKLKEEKEKYKTESKLTMKLVLNKCFPIFKFKVLPPFD